MTQVAVADLTSRIAASQRASAVERAWKVVKALERDRTAITGLQWVEPQVLQDKGITRTVDFSAEFPEVSGMVGPAPMDIAVLAPATKLVPGEDLNVDWTMPLLTRAIVFEGSLDTTVKAHIKGGGVADYLTSDPTVRPWIDVVSFIPFPKADAPKAEQFMPEFYVTLAIKAALGDQKNYFKATTRYGGKVQNHPVNDLRTFLQIVADPAYGTLFSAEMLMNMNDAEILATPADAGKLEVYVSRICPGGLGKKFDVGGLLGADRGEGSKTLSGYQGGRSLGGDDFLRGSLGGYGGTSSKGLEKPTRGGEFGGYRGLTSIPGGSTPKPQVPAAEAAKEVGEVKLREGTRGERQEITELGDYGFDGSFAVQPLRFTFYGVRETADPEALVRRLSDFDR